MTVKTVENLKGFTINRPPFVIFTICILLFCVALISLGSYIKGNEVPNYDIDYDWNTLLHGFSQLDFCLLPNDTQPDTITTTTTSSPFNTTSILATTTSSEDLFEDIEGSFHNTSLSISLSLRAHFPSQTEVHIGTTHLFSRFRASELGIEDGSEHMYVTFELHEPLKQLECNNVGCSKEILSACLTIIGPQYIFPKTRRPNVCNITDARKQERVTKMNVKSSKTTDAIHWCDTGTVAKANHQFDPKLTVMLSSAQRSIINMHLMYTSYFLFVMLITCVCYALVKGPPKHRTITHSTTNEKGISAPI